MQSRAIIVSRLVALAAGLALLAPSGMRFLAQGTAAGAEWRAYAGTTASTKYSPLDQINRNTVKNLRIAWRQSVTPVEVREAARLVHHLWARMDQSRRRVLDGRPRRARDLCGWTVASGAQRQDRQTLRRFRQRR